MPKRLLRLSGAILTQAVVASVGVAWGSMVTGAVDDVRTWLAGADVVVAPLRIARGIQNKVLEAMAMARPVVASTAAAEGIMTPKTKGIHYRIAKSAVEQEAKDRVLSFWPTMRHGWIALGAGSASACRSKHYRWDGRLAWRLRESWPQIPLPQAARMLGVGASEASVEWLTGAMTPTALPLCGSVEWKTALAESRQ